MKGINRCRKKDKADIKTMGVNKNVLAETGILFFGKILASATHEMKNNLAIINENAGLLGDLSMMAEQGQPMPHERTNDLSRKIGAQVQRTDIVLKRMNQFSHSVDLSEQTVDLEKTAAFVVNLGARLIEMQGAKIRITPPPSPILVSTHLFYLETIIWRSIEGLCPAKKENNQVLISFEIENQSPLIRFSSIRLSEKKIVDNIFDTPEDRALITYLNLTLKKHNNGFSLLWPDPKLNL